MTAKNVGTPLPAAKIGEDDTVMLNGAPAPTFGTFIRNLTPGSTAGLPGSSQPAGLAGAFSGESPSRT